MPSASTWDRGLLRGLCGFQKLKAHRCRLEFITLGPDNVESRLKLSSKLKSTKLS